MSQTYIFTNLLYRYLYLLSVQLKAFEIRNIFADMTDQFYGAQIFGFCTLVMTSSVVIANALYELALNQNIQDKLRSEIQNSYEELTFENISAISYLNAVLKDKYMKI